MNINCAVRSIITVVLLAIFGGEIAVFFDDFGCNIASFREDSCLIAIVSLWFELVQDVLRLVLEVFNKLLSMLTLRGIEGETGLISFGIVDFASVFM